MVGKAINNLASGESSTGRCKIKGWSLRSKRSKVRRRKTTEIVPARGRKTVQESAFLFDSKIEAYFNEILEKADSLTLFDRLLASIQYIYDTGISI